MIDFIKRTRYVCASEIGAICGLSPHESPESCWEKKRAARTALAEGRIADVAGAFAGNEDIERGNRLERAVCEWAAARICAGLTYPGLELETSIGYAPLLAHPDGVLSIGGVNYPLEVKCPRHQDSRSLPGWKAQLAVQAMLMDAPKGYLAIFADAELRIIEVPRDPDLEARIRNEADKWWHHVLSGTRPPPAGPASSEWLSHNIRQTTKEDAVSDNPVLARAAQRHADLGRYIKELEQERDTCAGKIKGAILESRGIRGQGWRATWTQSDRKRVDWEQVAIAAGATEADIARHTSVAQVRTLRVAVDSAKEE